MDGSDWMYAERFLTSLKKNPMPVRGEPLTVKFLLLRAGFKTHSNCTQNATPLHPCPLPADIGELFPDHH